MMDLPGMNADWLGLIILPMTPFNLLLMCNTSRYLTQNHMAFSNYVGHFFYMYIYATTPEIT